MRRNDIIFYSITDYEYHEIDTIMLEKYRPIFGGL